MKCASLISVLFAVSVLNTKAAPLVATLDGAWSITEIGHEYKNPGHAPPSTPVEYEVTARFDKLRATGKSMIHVPRGRTPPVRTFTFVKDDVDDLCRQLADELIAQGRIADGEQVLGLLKRKEYNDFLPGHTENAALATIRRLPTIRSGRNDLAKFWQNVCLCGTGFRPRTG